MPPPPLKSQSPQRPPVRLGAVSFLNSRPLTAALEDCLHEGPFSLVYDLPSACSRDLRAGSIDLGLVPIIEYALSPVPYALVPGVAVGCRGEVLTVRLFFRGDLGGVRTVAVDASSQTSVALLRILLAEKYGLHPAFEHAAPDLDEMLHRADAALLIGDPVLPLFGASAPEGRSQAGMGNSPTLRQSLDLGREWADLTGLPFVFACWAGREGALDPLQARRLVEARRQGEADIPRIARQFQRERAGSVELYERYLREHVSYDLGEAELSGVREFFRLAHLHGQIERVPELRFFPAAGRGEPATAAANQNQ